jgi:RHS repeat-associated protein
VYNVLGQLVAEYSQQGPQGTGGTLYLTSDHLGSTRVVTDQGKAIKGRHDYLPFGEEIPASLGRSTIAGYGGTDGLRHKFTAKERDSESNLDYFGARYMSGAQGRFTSPDDIYNDTNAADPSSWNRYAYVKNNPLTAVDPDGTAAVKVTDFTAQVLGLNQPRRNDVSYFKSYVANLAVAAIGGIQLSIGLATGSFPNLVPESVRNAADGNSQAKFDVNVGFAIGGLANAVTVDPITDPSRLLTEGTDTPNATGKVTSEILDDSTVFYRAHGTGANESGRVGRFLDPSKPASRAEAVSGSALPSGNPATRVSTLRVEGGVRIQRSTAAAAHGQKGGRPQVELLERAKIRVLKTEELK